MYRTQFTAIFFRELFLSGAWYWRILLAILVAFLGGAPAWLTQQPLVAAMLAAYGIPVWGYGLAAAAVIAVAFAWRMAALLTPRVFPTRVLVMTDHPENSLAHVRVEVSNVSHSSCDRLMCNLNVVETPFGKYPGDFPFTLLSQGRLRYAKEHNIAVVRGRWHLDPGETKNLELFQYGGDDIRRFFLDHESGSERFAESSKTIWECKLSGGVEPVVFWVFAFVADSKIVTLLARNSFDFITLDSFCAADFLPTGASA